MDVHSLRLLLRIKLVKTDGSDIEDTAPNTVGCPNNLLNSMFSSLSVSLNGKPVTSLGDKLSLQGLHRNASKLRF